MNIQNATNCTHTLLVCLVQQAMDELTGFYRGAVQRIRKSREQAEMYRVYRGFDAARLRDIGLDDPQKQLELLGRYL